MMAARRVVSSSLMTRLSRTTFKPSSPVLMDGRTFRFFSDDDKKKDSGKTDDPFGVNYDDGTDEGKLGPSSELPPKYVRDSTTGKFTGEIEAELTADERRLLKMDDIEKERLLMDRLVEKWEENSSEDGSTQQSKLAEQIRKEEMALNTIGRSARAQSVKGVTEQGEEAYQDETGFSKPLTPAEFRTFQEYMKETSGVDVTEDDIPVEIIQGGGVGDTTADNPDLDLTWMTTASQRAMEGDAEDDPFLDLMPSDFNPARKVNRRRAKPIPKQLLHHNNMSLLRRYVTRGGQIMNRIQSRLGAKDQRKVAKLIKRARHLGLIPYMGQWKYENHGNIYEKDIGEERDWEKELIRRGIVNRRAMSKKENDA